MSDIDVNEIELFWAVVGEPGNAYLYCQTEDEAIKTAERLLAKDHKRVFVLQPVYCVEAKGEKTKVIEI